MMIVHVIRMFRTRNFKYLYYYYKVHMPLAEKAKHKSNVTTTEATSKYLWNLNGSLCVNVFWWYERARKGCDKITWENQCKLQPRPVNLTTTMPKIGFLASAVYVATTYISSQTTSGLTWVNLVKTGSKWKH